MNYQDNIYGLQKTPEAEVQDGLDVALTTTGAAAQGAQIGSNFGPIGTAVGAVGGAALGFGAAKEQQNQERNRKLSDQAHNNFVSSMEGRLLRTNNLVRGQAEYGMNKTGRYEMVEMEGDGSGSQEGIGEIHTDKNFNVKKIAKGGPTHEEGGVDTQMAEGDIIFPTQGSEEKYNKINSAIKRYKLTGDKSAKKYLEKERDKLPTDEDYGYARDGKHYPDGRNPGPFTDSAWNQLQNQNQNYFGINPAEEATSSRAASITGKGSPAISKDTNPTYKEITDYDGNWDYRLNEKTGEVDVKRKGESNWRKPSASWNKPNSNENGQTNMELTRQRVFGDWNPPAEAPQSTSSPRTIQKDPRIAEPTSPQSKTQNAGKVGQAPVPQQVPEDGVRFDDLRQIGRQSNPLKHASALNNFIKGFESPEEVTRRYYNPEEFKYADRSYHQRRASAEQRNASNQMLRGKGLSIGQQQSYQGQTASRYLAQNEGINEREAQRADKYNDLNVQNINQAKLQNINLAHQYDIEDAQNRAAVDSYRDQSYSDIAQLAQLDEQRKYMMARNNKQYDMDALRLELLNNVAPNFSVDENDLGTISHRSNDFQN